MAAELLTVLLTCLVLGSAFAAPKSAGSLISPCSLKDAELEQCMMTQAKALLPQLATGIKEWGMPPLDPLHVTKMELHKSGNNAVNIEFSGNNLTFVGFTTMEIEAIKFDPKALRLEITFMIPQLDGNGDYKTNGKILLLPIDGEGDCEFSHTGHHAMITMDFKRVEKGGKIYLKIEKAHYDVMTVKAVHTNFNNLFNNKQLSDNMNKILSSNGIAVFKELRPAINIAFSDLMEVLWAPVFDRIPYTELFKDTE